MIKTYQDIEAWVSENASKFILGDVQNSIFWFVAYQIARQNVLHPATDFIQCVWFLKGIPPMDEKRVNDWIRGQWEMQRDNILRPERYDPLKPYAPTPEQREFIDAATSRQILHMLEEHFM